MPSTWILVADTCGARVYESRGVGHELRLVRDLPPRDAAGAGASSGLVIELAALPAPRSPGERLLTDPADDRGAADREARRFARELAWLLRRARSERFFQRLVLVAPTAMLASIRRELDPATRALVSREVTPAEGLADLAGVVGP